MSDAPRLPPAYRLVALDEVGSTNDEARALAEDGAEDGTLVWAQSQRAGRGRRGRSWHSPPGNLYLSLVLRPDRAPAEAAQLSFVAALGAAAAIGAVAPPLTEIAYKWPNDILVNDRKVAGILLESSITGGSRLDWLVLGMGMNLAAAPTETDFPATSLRDEGCGAIAPALMLERFSRHLLAWINRWLDDGFAPVRAAWLRDAKGIGEPISVALGEETVVGRFVEIDETGALVLEDAAGARRLITAGDVYFENARNAPGEQGTERETKA